METYTKVTDKKLISFLDNKDGDISQDVKEGDIVYGYWHGDFNWYKFKVQKEDTLYQEFTGHEGQQCGLGFDDGQSWFDINLAYHVVKSISLQEVNNLYNEAVKASKNSYSPYSNFAVGAAVLLKDGMIIHGANTENGSFGGTICAERSALSFGGKKLINNVKAIAVYGEGESVPPCGMCRQFIIEFGEDIEVIFKYEGEIIVKTISELLPYKFNFNKQ